jgi:predicted lipoprotein with Yx(FWY)xxD motif
MKGLRNGDAGEQKGKPSCDNVKQTETSGLMSPYPAGLILPEVETRPTCTEVWPPVYAAADAKPVGKWTVVTRSDGTKQWAYDGYALYTSVLDKIPGETNGGTKRRTRGDAPAYREPVGPSPNLPPQFRVVQQMTGRILTSNGFSVYTWDKDGPNKSNCDANCAKTWTPVLAPAYAKAQGELSIFERAPGINQWAFRKRPLYTRIEDEKIVSLEGSDIPGWHNVYTTMAPPAPKDFIVQDTRAGQVLADKRGMTVYIYGCGDDAIDQLSCDHPDTPQAYRYAMCGGGDPKRCLETFPYVIADKNAKSGSLAWKVMAIDPQTGRRAKPGAEGAIYVWAFRDRPVYTFARDKFPGDVGADGWGEFNGWRNGFKAFWLRDDFRNNAG